MAAKKDEEVDWRDGPFLPKCQLDHRGGQCRRQHWLEYDPVAFAVLLIGIGFCRVDRVDNLNERSEVKSELSSLRG